LLNLMPEKLDEDTMLDTRERPTAADHSADKKAAKAEIASIVRGITSLLKPDEQLLACARASIAGGIMGKLSIGPEAMVHPLVNIALTDRRLILQHVNAESKSQVRTAPHSFLLTEMRAMEFSDLAIHGHKDSARLVVTLSEEQHIRLRISGPDNFKAVSALARVYEALTGASRHSGTANLKCEACQHSLDNMCRFCPFCGAEQKATAASTLAVETETVPDETPDALIAVDAEEAAPTALVSPVEPWPAEPSLEPAVSPEAESPEALAPQAGLDESDATDTPTDAVEFVETTPEIAPAEPANVDFIEPATYESQDAPATEGAWGCQEAPAIAAEPTDATSADDASLTPAPDVAHWEPAAEQQPVLETESPAAEHESCGSPVPADGFVWDIPAAEPDFAPIVPSEEPTIHESTDTFAAQIDAVARAAEAAAELEQLEESVVVPALPEPQPEPPVRTVAGMIVHFSVNHPAVQFHETLKGGSADEIVGLLKSHAANSLKFPLKLAVMRMTPLEFCREVIQRYNYTEGKSLPIPATCEEFLATSQLIGYARVEPYYAD
jgi:hypothetical protein